MQGPVEILAPDINIELDLAPLRQIIHRTNCIVMPQHGITTLGETLSEAYHRACSIVAETRRLLYARILAGSVGMDVPYVSEADVKHMFEIGRKAIYGSAGPRPQSATAERRERSAAPC
jgi:L-fuculose-phosphate aldolase